MSLESQRNITVSIDWPGLGQLGTFAKRTGGQGDSEEQKFPPGGMQPEVSLGGRQTVDNVTVQRLFVRERDRPLAGPLYAARGKANVTVADQFLDRDGNAYGAPVVWTGTLKSFAIPDADSESNDAALISLEISTNASVAA